jgi:RNA polymerase sigma-70 factor (ECF subfamily)
MEDDFKDLIARVRAGDARAAEELVRRYELVIRMEVRRELRDPRLRRYFDSLDICQSVLSSFFVRATLGQDDLDDPAKVVKLLVGMTKNKVAEQARREGRQCRDYRRSEPLGPQVEKPDSGPGPSEVVAGEELLQAIQRELTTEEKQLAERRSRGQSWAEIVSELGGTIEARKKQMERAIARVRQRFGLDEQEHD